MAVIWVNCCRSCYTVVSWTDSPPITSGNHSATSRSTLHNPPTLAVPTTQWSGGFLFLENCWWLRLGRSWLFGCCWLYSEGCFNFGNGGFFAIVELLPASPDAHHSTTATTSMKGFSSPASGSVSPSEEYRIRSLIYGFHASSSWATRSNRWLAKIT